jgi:hypothetical protein
MEDMRLELPSWFIGISPTGVEEMTGLFHPLHAVGLSVAHSRQY